MPSRKQLRTRRDILNAASRLAAEGKAATMETISEEAMVSRATVYRYFPSVELLLAEASVDIEAPRPEIFFEGDPSEDPVDRLVRIEAALHEVMYANEGLLRHHLAASLRGTGEDSVPQRQNRRIPMIEAALAPVRSRFTKGEYDRLCSALALLFGTEAMIVFRDVHPLSPERAGEVKRWMIRALVEASLADASRGRAAGK